MAPWKTKQGTTGEQLYFLRKDIEASDIEKNILAQLPANSNVKDWEDILSTEDDVVLALSWRMSKMANKFGLSWLKDLCHQFWYAYTQRIVKRVAQVFLSERQSDHNSLTWSYILLLVRNSKSCLR